MSKVRVYELARETGLPNKEVIRRLEELGIEAKSHSSTVTDADATEFRESLGRSRAERQRQAEEHARREAEEYDLEAIKTPPTEAKARRILPPHLRKQQEEQEQREQREREQPAQPAAEQEEQPQRPARLRPAAQPFRPDQSQSGGVSVGGESQEAPDGGAGSGQQAAPQQPAQPQQPAARTEEPAEPRGDPAAQRPSASEMAERGLVRPAPEDQPAEQQPAQPAQQPQPTQQPAQQPAEREPQAPREGGEEQGTPGVPRPGTPPRPGQPIRPPSSPSASGTPVQPKRRVEPDLPREGSGRRKIPPPVRPAPAREEGGRTGGEQPAAKGKPAQDRGPAAPGDKPAAPGGQRPGSGERPGGAGAPERPAGPGRRKKKGKKKREPTLAEQFEEQAKSRRGRKQPAGPVKAHVEGPVEVTPGITVSELAGKLGVNPTDIVRVLFGMGEMVTVTQSLSEDLVELVGAEMDAEITFVSEEELEFGSDEEDPPEALRPRAPVVTVMGHVDHGKTKLLDAVRQADVASGEHGGITQHIGAYQVTKSDRQITFIDTPGHEAFTQMRARGASVTDVAILVVAADDGVMPQTVEALNHAKAAGVPIVVAVNKIDREGADPNRVRTQLTEHDLVAEEFGGQTTMVDVSAITGDGLDDLLEMILLQADVMELSANPDRDARGAVIEAHLDRGRGPTATVLVQSGTLRVGDALVAGTAHGRIRAMFSATGDSEKEAGPSEPVQILGLDEVPDAGDEFRVVESERHARDIAEKRQARERRRQLAEQRPTMSLEDLSGAIAEGQQATLNLIVKGDVAGSVEAVADAMNKLDLPDGVKIRIVHKGVGAITENDVSLAEASGAIVIGFNVRPEANARQAIKDTGVDLRQYSVIYQAVEDVERAVKGLLAPVIEEHVLGRAEVRETFRVPRVGMVAGCLVTEGSVRRNALARVVRDSVVVAEDKIDSLKRFKDDATEVATNYECGIGLDKFNDVKVGDEIEVYERREVQPD